MQLQSVEITNIRGIEHSQFRAGALTVARGRNGSGKSSLLNAVSDVFEGGHDPSMIRQGAKKGVITLTLDDGTTIEKTITPKSATTVVKNAAGEVIPAPATFIATLARGFAFDPLAFVRASHKERAEYLSKVMPVTIMRKQILAACEEKRLAPLVARQITGEQFDIASLNLLRKRIYDDRAAVNKSIRIQEGGIDALRKTLPPNWKPEGDAAAVTEEAEASVSTAQASLDAIHNMRTKSCEELRAAGQLDLSAVDKWESAEIDAIRQRATGKRKEINDALASASQAMFNSFSDEIGTAEEALSKAKADRAVAKEQASHFAKQKEAAATIEQYQKDLRSARAEEEVFTTAIAAIDAAKDGALKSLPVPGLSTVDGEVMYQQEGLAEPIPFDSVNTQRQYELALQIAAQGAGKLGLMVLDNTEALDTAHWDQFKAAVAASGFQILAARVDDAPGLDVEPIGAAEGA